MVSVTEGTFYEQQKNFHKFQGPYMNKHNSNSTYVKNINEKKKQYF